MNWAAMHWMKSLGLLARQSARNSMETALWLASHLSCFPGGLAGFLQGFLQEFLQGFCGLFLTPTLSQLFPRKKLQKLLKVCKISLKTVVFQFFLRVTDSFPTLSQNSWERVGKELGKSWEGADTSRAFREILGYFLDSL